MGKVTYINSKGEANTIELDNGTTIMEGAIFNGIDGIIAECGGSCACATCHVYVDESFLDKLPPIGEYEAEMLEETASEHKTNSRLSCQLRMSDELSKLIVHTPSKQ